MFYYINLGTVAALGMGTLTVGGGSYVIWHFKDTIVSTALHDTGSNPASNNFPEEFSENLQEIQNKQSQLADAETKLVDLNAEQTAGNITLQVLKTEITNIKANLDKWTTLEKNSEEAVNALKQKECELKIIVDQKEQERREETEKLTALQQSTSTLNNLSVADQAETDAALAAKEAIEKSVEKLSDDLTIATKELEKITIFVAQLTSQEELKKSDFDTKTNADNANSQAITNQIQSIKQKIETDINQIDQELTQINSDIDKLQSEITTLKKAEETAKQEISKLDTNPQYQPDPINDSDLDKVQKQENNSRKAQQKQNKREELEETQNTSKSSWTQKNEEKIAKETTKNNKTSLKTKLNNCKNHAEQYNSSTFRNIDCSQTIKDEISVLEGLHTNKQQSANALALSKSEYDGIKAKKLLAESDKSQKQTKKDTLSSSKTSEEEKIQGLTNDYSAKKNKSDKKHKDKEDNDRAIATQTAVVAEKYQAYEEVQKEYQKIIENIAEAETKHKELTDAKTSLEADLKVKEQSEATQTKELEEKEKQIKQQTEVIKNQST